MSYDDFESKEKNNINRNIAEVACMGNFNKIILLDGNECRTTRILRENGFNGVIVIAEHKKTVYQKQKRSRSSYDISSKWSEERLIYRNRSNSSFSKTLIFIIMILVLLFLYIIDFDLSIFT